jgi:hypothetical protein
MLIKHGRHVRLARSFCPPCVPCGSAGKTQDLQPNAKPGHNHTLRGPGTMVNVRKKDTWPRYS